MAEVLHEVALLLRRLGWAGRMRLLPRRRLRARAGAGRWVPCPWLMVSSSILLAEMVWTCLAAMQRPPWVGFGSHPQAIPCLFCGVFELPHLFGTFNLESKI